MQTLQRRSSLSVGEPQLLRKARRWSSFNIGSEIDMNKADSQQESPKLGLKMGGKIFHLAIKLQLQSEPYTQVPSVSIFLKGPSCLWMLTNPLIRFK